MLVVTNRVSMCTGTRRARTFYMTFFEIHLYFGKGVGTPGHRRSIKIKMCNVLEIYLVHPWTSSSASCARPSLYLPWFSVADVVVAVFHPDLKAYRSLATSLTSQRSTSGYSTRNGAMNTVGTPQVVKAARFLTAFS